MADTLSRTSPHTGTVLPEGRPFWIVDGKAYDLTEWMGHHPGGPIWFAQTEGRDISALLHTYHRDPARLQKILAKYEIKELEGKEVRPKLVAPFRLSDRNAAPDMPLPTEKDVLPKLGVPPFLLPPEFNASTDLPKLDYRDQGSLLAAIRERVNEKFSKRDLKRYNRVFDVVTWIIALAHVATLALLITKLIPAWAFVIIMVVTRTALAGSGHYHLHRKWKPGKPGNSAPFSLPMGKALFDINYVGTSLIGTDGHVLLHHPYLGSGADVKKTFFDGMLRLHPVLRVPGYTLHKLGICLTGLPLRAREITRFERPRPASESGVPFTRDGIRADFWLIRAWIVVEFALCLATGHIVAWLVQFFLALWFNTFLVVASHDFEDPSSEEELAVIPEPLRDDWAARQICLSYDLSVVGNRYVDLFLSAGLSPHRVHHVLPWQGSGFANLASEDTVREVCAEVGIAWARPRNLILDRFPAVIRHYLTCPVKPSFLRTFGGPPPDGGPPPGFPSAAPVGAQPPPPPGMPPPPPDGGPPPFPTLLTAPPPASAWNHIGEMFRYALEGFKGVGV